MGGDEKNEIMAQELYNTIQDNTRQHKTTQDNTRQQSDVECNYASAMRFISSDRRPVRRPFFCENNQPIVSIYAVRVMAKK